jgi:hypothetical protein
MIATETTAPGSAPHLPGAIPPDPPFLPPMNRSLKPITALLLAGLLPLTALIAAAADRKDAKPAYPLTTCVVSDEKLGEMGKPFEYVHKEAGKPDRVILLCCDSCVKDFQKDPAKYLKKLDEAAAGKANAKAGSAHQH